MYRGFLILSHSLCIVLQKFVMRRLLQHIVLVSVLFSYLAVGVLSHLKVLNLLALKTADAQITNAKAGPPPTAKVYWTQYKHIPSIIKVSVPSAVEFIPPRIHRVCLYGIAFIKDVFIIFPDPLFSLYPSRAPPLC